MPDIVKLVDPLALRHHATLARAAVATIMTRKGPNAKAYLARCREFGLLLRAHGLAQCLWHWKKKADDQQSEFAEDFCMVLDRWMPSTAPESVRDERLDRYLLRSQVALEVADMFKRYGNALLDEAPKWTKQAPSTKEESSHA